MLKIIRADSPDFSRYYIYSDNEPDKTTKIVNLLKTLPENSFARGYFVSDGDIADPEKI